jgi:translation initiation factor 1
MAKKKIFNTGGIVYSTSGSYKAPTEEEEIISIPFNQQRPTIKLDKKHRGGKTVTLIEGLQMNYEDLEDFSKQLKTFCGGGGSAKNGEIIIQGDHRDKVLQWFLKKGFSQSRKI